MKKPAATINAAQRRAAPSEAPPPPTRKRQNVTRGETGLSRVPPEVKDPEFMSAADLHLRELFAQAFVAHGTLAKAAEAAGYTGTPQSLRTAGYRLYHEPAVQARIKQVAANAVARLRITQDDVLAELSRIGFQDIGEITHPETGELLPLRDIPEDTRRALSSYKITERIFGETTVIEKEVKFENKSNALQQLGKHAGLWGKEDDAGPGIAAEEFLKALTEGMYRVANRARVIEHKP